MGDIRVQPWLRAAMDTFPDEVRALGPAIAGGVPGTCTGPPAEVFDERARRGCTEPGGEKLSDRREKPSGPAQLSDRREKPSGPAQLLYQHRAGIGVMVIDEAESVTKTPRRQVLRVHVKAKRAVTVAQCLVQELLHQQAAHSLPTIALCDRDRGLWNICRYEPDATFVFSHKPVPGCTGWHAVYLGYHATIAGSMSEVMDAFVAWSLFRARHRRMGSEKHSEELQICVRLRLV
jgi:hypothetical protein